MAEWPVDQCLVERFSLPVRHDRPTFSSAWNDLTWSERALLFGATAWDLHLFCRIASRSLEMGWDDLGYDEARQQPGFWNRALFSIFLPEAIFQSSASLPFVASFRYGLQYPVPKHADVIHELAVVLFSAGFALETLAVLPLEKHKRERKAGLYRDGV